MVLFTNCISAQEISTIKNEATTNTDIARKQNRLLLNFGLGFSKWGGIPVYAGFEYFVHRDISIGAEIGYQHFKRNYSGYNYGINIFTAMPVGNYHFNHLLHLPSKWDLYAGLNLDFYNQSFTKPSAAPEYYEYRNSALSLGLQVGARYFFATQWGINLEWAGGSSLGDMKVGLTHKF